MNYMRYRICLKMWFILGAICLMSCSGGNDSLADTNIEKEDGQKTVIIEPISGFVAKETNRANELLLEWKNPSNIAIVEILYSLKGKEELSEAINVRVYGERNSSYTLKLVEYGIYQVSAVAIDNYGKRSEKVTILATPAKEDTIDPDIIVENKLPIADPICSRKRNFFSKMEAKRRFLSLYVVKGKKAKHFCNKSSFSGLIWSERGKK